MTASIRPLPLNKDWFRDVKPSRSKPLKSPYQRSLISVTTVHEINGILKKITAIALVVIVIIGLFIGNIAILRSFMYLDGIEPRF